MRKIMFFSVVFFSSISVLKYFTVGNHITKAVDDVNLQIYMNEFVLIKVRSGAGKSTLLNLMCGLDKPTNGSISIENKAIEKLSNKALSGLLSKRIRIIFQNFNLLPTYTVYENIEIALDPISVKREDTEENILPILKQLGLTDKVKCLLPEISIGQQQKVAIARTLAKKPSIIFADEPTTEIIQHLLFLKKELNLTLVMASHGGTLDKYADRVVLMQNGKINS